MMHFPGAPLITWPAIIKYAGQAELAYVQDQAEWNADVHLHGFRYEMTDVLIDSKGEIYALLNAVNGPVRPEPMGRFARLEEVIEMVRAHAAQMGSCCVSKFYASSIQEAVSAVSALD
jgi:hypothetical protein